MTCTNFFTTVSIIIDEQGMLTPWMSDILHYIHKLYWTILGPLNFILYRYQCKKKKKMQKQYNYFENAILFGCLEWPRIPLVSFAISECRYLSSISFKQTFYHSGQWHRFSLMLASTPAHTQICFTPTSKFVTPGARKAIYV